MRAKPRARVRGLGGVRARARVRVGARVRGHGGVRARARARVHATSLKSNN